MRYGQAACAVPAWSDRPDGKKAGVSSSGTAPATGEALPPVASIRHGEPVEEKVRALWQRKEYGAATQAILEHYQNDVRSFLRTRTRDESTAEDVFSVFCENIWKGLPGFRFEGKLRPWVFIVARNALSKHMRNKTRWYQHHVFVGPEETESHLDPEDSSPSFLKVRLSSLVSDLPVSDRDLLKQRVMLSMNWNDIAQVQLDDGQRQDSDAVTRESARLRKHYQTLVKKLRKQLVDGAAENQACAV